MPELYVVEEHAITDNLASQLAALLEASFPDTFAGRTYYKQEPHRRVLAIEADEVVGQVGLDMRVIIVGGHVMRIAGVIDLCVAPDCRGQGIGSALLGVAEDLATRRDFLVLMADRHMLYERHGYRRLVPAPARWLGIEDLRSWGVVERDLGDCFMLKPVGGRDWPEGTIDLLGYLF